ncbi:unnamed protein product [Rotaria socialis]
MNEAQKEIMKTHEKFKQKEIEIENHYRDMKKQLGAILSLSTTMMKQHNKCLNSVINTMNEIIPMITLSIGLNKQIIENITKPNDMQEVLPVIRNATQLQTWINYLHERQQLISMKYAEMIDNFEKKNKPLTHGIELLAKSIETYNGSLKDKESISKMINEWNTRTCISDINMKWKKERPTHTTNTNVTIILFNKECLNTHTDDVDLILNKHAPHLCLLTGVGKATEKMPVFPGYTAITQAGTNSFGGVPVMYQKSLNCKIVEKETNFILCEVETTNTHIIIGVVYVPPGTLPPFQIFNKCKSKQFFIFGDFNAKHTTCGCSKNNTSGIHLFDWLEATGNDLILPTSSTSKRSNAIIDFGITDSSQGWLSQVLNEATSDHWPVIFDAPFLL